jgi:hypothetical protein
MDGVESDIVISLQYKESIITPPTLEVCKKD